jgi:tRNA C32,U32 (ribose-2'-O)-methylase TrmJ
MSLVSDDGATLSEEDAVKRGEQAKLRLEIEDLKEQLKDADSPAERIRIEANLKRLVARTEVDGGSAMSMDSILEQVKESKRKTNSLRGAVLRNRGY